MNRDAAIDDIRLICHHFSMRLGETPIRSHLPKVDAQFFDTFMPYELRLAQRRAMVWGSKKDPHHPLTFFGLYLVRLEPLCGGKFPARDMGGDLVGDHVYELLCSSTRDSDIPGRLKNQEHLAIARDIDPEYAYVIAQRFLSAAGRSDVLKAASMQVRVGYIIYPLSSPPNFPVDRWSTLVDLARLLSLREPSDVKTSGYGLIRGRDAADAGIPEADLVPLALQDPEPMVKAGILQLQRIQVLQPVGPSPSR